MARPIQLLATLASALILAAPLVVATAAHAQGAGAQGAGAQGAGARGASITVPAGAGQDAIALVASEKGVVGRACAAGCAAGADAPAVGTVPAEVLPELSKGAFETIGLADGKKVARLTVTVPAKEGEASTWTMLVAGPLTSAKSAAPVVLWSGYVGKKGGLEGEESVNVVRVEPLAKGARIVVGEQRADLTVCGRPAIVAAREVDPATMTLAKGAMVDSLSADERKKAEKVIAVRETGEGAVPAVRLLRATTASSALEKKVATLTDGSIEQGWTEAKIGDGHGEWVRMSASSDVGITGLSVRVRPTGVEVPDGAAPRTLYFATDEKVFEVQLPDSTWGDTDARYEVKLPAEVKTSCLAVVLGDAHAPRGVTNPRVTLAEITARTTMDGMSYEALSGALAGGGERSKAAAAMLGKGDARAVSAVSTAWEKLDVQGRKLAMEIVDGAACGDQAPFWADVLAVAKGKKMSGPAADPVVVHARDRLRRCGRASAPPLAKLLREAPDLIRVVAAEELALVAPADAIPAILDVLPKMSDGVRRDLRGALAKAANNAKAKDALAEWMKPEKLATLGDIAKVDLLRAMGPVLPEIAGGKDALVGITGKDASFRTKYLLLAPSAELAAKGDAEAEAFVKAALVKDADPHVRARAAEVAAKVAKLVPELLTAAADPEVRVREAAVRALTQTVGQGTKLPAGADAVLIERLTKDDWTFVRVGAAEALGAMPKGDTVDQALASALGDKSSEVRGRALDGLGGHKARAFAGKVREVSQSKDELVEVRARAVVALGTMCDKDSVDYLSKLALGATSITSDVEKRLGAAALSALGDLQPDDLADRIAPLTGKDAPALVREMAKAALSAKNRCNKKKAD